MESLKQQKESLGKEAGPHRTKVKACDTILSPMRRVPYDVLREITLYSMPQHPSPILSDVPLSVAQVCSAWRAAVLSSPHLWTTLFLRLDRVNQFKRYGDLAREWFKRAKGLPLSFFIFYNCKPDDCQGFRDLCFRSLLSRFKPFISQVRHLGIGASWVGDILPLFVDIGQDWDLRKLERLDFLSPGSKLYYDALDNGIEPPTIAPITLFNSAPLLRKLTIQNEILSSEGILIETWIKIMRRCPQLKIGHFLVRDLGERDVVPKNYPFEHSHLEYLSLEIKHDHPHSVDLLKIFDLPNLRHLELAHYEQMPTEDLPSPRGVRQLSSLRSLFLPCWNYPLEYLIAILQEASNLEELVLGAHRALKPLKKFLISTPLSTLLPRLSVLTMIIGASTFRKSVDIDTFVTMIKSRCMHLPCNSQRLEHLFIDDVGLGNRHLLGDLEERLKPCVKNGLVLKIGKLPRPPWLEDRIEPFDGWVT